MIKIKCPKCGNELSVDSNLSKVFCMYCGNEITEFNSGSGKNKVNLKKDNYDDPVQDGYAGNTTAQGENMHESTGYDSGNADNLYISYKSINKRVLAVTRIAETGQKNTYIDGQTVSFHLTPGKHIVVVKIGKKNYNRAIYITKDNKPVKIYAAYTGRGRIDIDQPAYDPNDMKAPVKTASVETAPSASTDGKRLRKSPMAIVAFVLSFMYITSPIAVLLGIVDITVFRNDKKAHGLSIAAIVIGICFSLALIPAFCSCTNETVQSTGNSTESSLENTVDYLNEIASKYGEDTDGNTSGDSVGSETSDVSDKELALYGSYDGDDGSGLVIFSDGTALAYFEAEEYCESNCPWTYENDVITITLGKLHCDITAKVKENSDELVFKSDSANWSTEKYVKSDDNEDKYVDKCMNSPYDNIDYLLNGEYGLNCGDIRFEVPKYYWIGSENPLIFTSTSVDYNGYGASIHFNPESGKNAEAIVSCFSNECNKLVENAAGGYIDNIECKVDGIKTIDNSEVLIVYFSGNYDGNFGTFSYFKTNGIYCAIHNLNDNSVTEVVFSQTDSDYYDYEDDFINMIDSLYVISE